MVLDLVIHESILKHLGLWLVKRKPQPRADTPIATKALGGVGAGLAPGEQISYLILARKARVKQVGSWRQRAARPSQKKACVWRGAMLPFRDIADKELAVGVKLRPAELGSHPRGFGDPGVEG